MIIKGLEKFPRQGPLIVVSNHPNTFMDPIIIGVMTRQPVYFLAKASVFGSPLRDWVFSRLLHMIPVYRQEDAKPGQVVDNSAIFRKCFDFLSKQGTLLIFPEGTSIMERRLQKIKTGTARIALGAEKEHGYQLGMRIVTVGLNYSGDGNFRESVTVNIGEPIRVSEWAELHQSDEFAAANALTERIRQELESHVIVTRDTYEEEFVMQIQQVFGEKLDNVSVKEKDFWTAKMIVEALRFFELQAPEQVAELRQRVQRYLHQLGRLRLSDELLTEKNTNQNIALASLKTVIYTLLGFLPYFYGLLNNYLPYKIPSLVAKAVSSYKEYYAPIAMVTGIFTFLIFYPIQIAVFHQVVGLPVATLAYAVSLPVSGFFTLHYWGFLEKTRGNWRLLSLFTRRKELLQALVQERIALHRMLKTAQENFGKVAQ